MYFWDFPHNETVLYTQWIYNCLNIKLIIRIVKCVIRQYYDQITYSTILCSFLNKKKTYKYFLKTYK